MANERDICERLEDQSIDGSIFLRLNAAKEIRALRHYVAWLENNLAKTETDLEKAWGYSSKQAVDIVTLGQEVGRLREALEKIATTQGGGDCCSAYEWFVHTKQIARVALAEKGEK